VDDGVPPLDIGGSGLVAELNVSAENLLEDLFHSMEDLLTGQEGGSFS
jgi:hypothetical protein